ncbi:MAG: YciI family protein [Ignavibacteriae bacterium]|nr:YciI family protein [Ignavibacteriota bacterium]
MYYILTYKTVDQYVARRDQFRDAHLSYAAEYVKRGELLLGGALDEPVDSAVLIFQGETPSVAEEFAKNDPYVRNGLITQWTVRKWNVVVGSKL